MSGWDVLGIIVVIGWGGLMFLKLAADETDTVRQNLRALDRRERQAEQRRREGTTRQDQPAA